MAKDELRQCYYYHFFEDFDYTIDVRREQGDTQAPQGLIFRASQSGLYAFMFVADGVYAVQKCGVDGCEWLIPPSESPAINKGLNVWNTLRVVCRGRDLAFYINGELLGEGTDPSPPSLGGLSGIFAFDEISDQGKPIVSFDNAVLITKVMAYITVYVFIIVWVLGRHCSYVFILAGHGLIAEGICYFNSGQSSSSAVINHDGYRKIKSIFFLRQGDRNDLIC